MPQNNGLLLFPIGQVCQKCLVFQSETLGTCALGETPVVGDHVRIRASDKLVVRGRAAMSFNAVVVHAGPAHHSAIGVPARCRPNNLAGAVHG